MSAFGIQMVFAQLKAKRPLVSLSGMVEPLSFRRNKGLVERGCVDATGLETHFS